MSRDFRKTPLTAEQEKYRIERTKAVRKAEWAAMWPEERKAKARKAVNTLWERRRATFGYNPRPYLPLQMHKKSKPGAA